MTDQRRVWTLKDGTYHPGADRNGLVVVRRSVIEAAVERAASLLNVVDTDEGNSHAVGELINAAYAGLQGISESFENVDADGMMLSSIDKDVKDPRRGT